MKANALPYKITIYRDASDTTGLDVSESVSVDGLALQRSPLEMEAPVTCTGQFTLVANSNDPSFDPDTSTYIRPGARVYFQYRNYAGNLVDVPWGARQVIAFASATRPDSIDPGQQVGLWQVEVKTHQTLLQQQVIERAFDAEFGTTQPGQFQTREQREAFRDYVALATGICRYKTLTFSPQPGDPAPLFQYNTQVTYDPRSADSALAFLNKLLYSNPDVSGKTYYLWQDNQERVRIGVANLTTTRVQADLLLDARWEVYSEDLLSFKPINQQRQQLPGRLRINAIVNLDVLKENPLVAETRSPSANNAGIQTAYSFDFNNWIDGTRTIRTRLTVPTSVILPPEKLSGATSSQAVQESTEIIKSYDLFRGRRLFQVELKKYGPQHLADDSGSLNQILMFSEITNYYYKVDGTLDNKRIQQFALPKLIGADTGNNPLALKGAKTSVEQVQSGGGSGYSKAKFQSLNVERQSDYYVNAPAHNANNPGARPEQAEIQEDLYYSKVQQIFADRLLQYNGVLVSDRIKPVSVSNFAFGGDKFNNLCDNIAFREAGSYTQYAIKFALSDAIASAWTKPGMGLLIYDYLSQKTKVFGSFGGETIVFGKESVECLINAEYIGTTEDGTLITAAEVGRATLSGQQRVTLDNIARVT